MGAKFVNDRSIFGKKTTGVYPDAGGLGLLRVSTEKVWRLCDSFVKNLGVLEAFPGNPWFND